ncbi:MAG: TonB-dependent receptor, partial [Candidatus Neomarinimicrobiota bacterium]
DLSGISDTIIHSVDSRLRHRSLTRRMGIHMEGSTPFVYYTFFMNHGRNQRQPTINDLFLWANSDEEELRESPLAEEFLSTTDIGLNLIYRPRTSSSVPLELSITTNFFINLYTNKITYRFYEDRPPSPLNTAVARISGYDLAFEGNLWDRRVRGQWAYQSINLNDPLIFPNKPQFRMTYLMEFRLPWLVVGYDFYRDGPQFILYDGFVIAERIERRESANLNIILRWKVRRLQMSLAFTVRNLFSDLPVRADPLQNDAYSPFQYYESHRKIITFRVSL